MSWVEKDISKAATVGADAIMKRFSERMKNFDALDTRYAAEVLARTAIEAAREADVILTRSELDDRLEEDARTREWGGSL